MAKVGNYIQRDYHGTYSSKKKSTWSDFNKSWGARRAAAAEKMQNLRTIAHNFNTISTYSSQANTSLVMQSRGSQSVYSSPTAVMSRINVVI
ncbi:flagellar biosynthesis protein [uncultured Roseibium sp.]|uniref:flagellar biosynthesis protein n=1 Tax=uncultured Roseibium sp. TaxID=1936171 RepID=UPI0026080367|nr:flagellar biosynthesis protein [uncultured Roseibium sp.]